MNREVKKLMWWVLIAFAMGFGNGCCTICQMTEGALDGARKDVHYAAQATDRQAQAHRDGDSHRRDAEEK